MLKVVAENIWEVDHPFSIAGVKMGHRMTVIRRSDGSLLVHSPVKWDPTLGYELTALGPVKHVIAPSIMHDLHLEDWMTEYGQAETWCAPGLQIKRELSNESQPWLPEVRHRVLDGIPRMNESMFLHVPSRTLIVADLVFNIGPDLPLYSKIFWKLNGAFDRLTPTRMFKSMVKNRAAFKDSLEEVLAWDFDRLIVGHGRNVNSGARDALYAAFLWL
jgi:hypothetical protein